MADNSMTDEKWEQIGKNLDAWFLANPEHSNRQPIADGIHSLGEQMPETRKFHFQSLASLFKDLNLPRGWLPKKPSIEDDSGFSDYLGNLFSDAILVFKNFPTFMATTLRHPKSGGGLYATAEDYAEYIVKTARYRLKRAFTAYVDGREDEALYWDGSFDGDGDPILSFSLNGD